ncbi:MAG: hypothetical protein NXH79_01220 [Rhodobacteraceae bacterium]|nr:hypothetical protein [Paracoccaceae bacterium]
MPEIALRVALTYNSQIVHTFTGTDGLNVVGPAATNFQTTIPESWMLEAQSGIAEDTLLFGSIRYVDWSDFQICPTNFPVPGGCLTNLSNDTVTYTAGLGRRFTDSWSGAVTVLREPQVGGNASNLNPTDGRTALGLAVTWENEQFEVTGGLQYSWLDDTGPLAATTGVFTDNTAVSAGLRVGIRF